MLYISPKFGFDWAFSITCLQKSMNTGLHILTLEELGETDSFLTKWKALTGPHGDIYYDLTYLKITEVLDGGTILLALFAHALGNVVYPFVLRPISGPTIDVKPGAGLFDIITPFEFGGPLFIGDDRHRCWCDNLSCRLRKGFL